jgi:general secretion pathway protein H
LVKKTVRQSRPAVRHGPASRRRLEPNGLTLIETMVALAVMGFILALAVPMMSGGQGGGAELRAAAETMSGALRSVRSHAVAQNREEVFLVDTDQALYRAADAAPVSLPRNVRLMLFTTTQEQISSGIGAIRFYPDGSSTGGGLSLIKGDARYDVLVNWLTGRVTTDDRRAARHP